MATDFLVPSAAVVPERPRKRRRFTWDYAGPLTDVQLAAVYMASIPARDEDASATGASASSPTTPYDTHFMKEACAVSTRCKDDEDGHMVFELGDDLTSRYKILRKMGEGTFGRVLECWDRECHERVAIKVIRSDQKYQEDAMIEIDVLNVVANGGKTGSRSCVQMRRWFNYHDHVCIVCEKLGPSLYDFLKANDYKPYSIDLVRDFGFQLLESVACMAPSWSR